jgi:hypothetical protein
MKTILNIGLGPSKAAPEGIALGRAVDLIMRRFGSAYMEFRAVTNGEPTVVVVVDGYVHPDNIHGMALALEQDCIAHIRMMAGQFHGGELSGPHAADWGAFDPAHFILPTRYL